MNTRVEWVDTARGIAIIAVVMFHAAIFLAAADSSWQWESVMQSLETFRMPLFFFAAGLFSAKILRQTFAELWHRRIALFLYLYVLWSVIRWVFFQPVPFALTGNDPSDWRELATIFVWPSGGLWFLYALMIYSLFVWCCRRLPPWVPLGVSIAVSLLFSSRIFDIDNDAWIKVGSYGAFFVIAVYAKDRTLAAAERLSTVTAIGLVVLYGVLAAAYQVLDLREVFGARFLVSVGGVAAGVALSVLLVRLGRFQWLSWLGQHTLPIYLVHYLPIAAVAALLVATGVTLPGILGAVAVPALAAAAIAVSLLIDRLLRNVHGVFDLPRIRLREPSAAK